MKIEDNILKLKTFQPKQGYREENKGIEGVEVFLTKINSWYLVIVKKGILAYLGIEGNPIGLLAGRRLGWLVKQSSPIN